MKTCIAIVVDTAHPAAALALETLRGVPEARGLIHISQNLGKPILIAGVAPGVPGAICVMTGPEDVGTAAAMAQARLEEIAPGVSTEWTVIAEQQIADGILPALASIHRGGLA